MLAILKLILPDFLIITLGWLLLHKFRFSADFFKGAERLVYYVLFPALLFYSINQTSWSLSEASYLLVAVACVIATGIGLAWLALPVLKPEIRAISSVAQCGFRFNTYLGLSLAQAIGGPQGTTIMALLVGFGVPLCNMAAVAGLAQGRGGIRILKEIAKNPFILATIAALVWNLSSLPIPGPVNVALSRLGACALAIGLICVGATLSLQGALAQQKLIGWITAVKLLAMPAMALLVSSLLGLSPTERQMLLIYSALPTASASHVLAGHMGGDARLVALTMSVGTILAAITIPLWLSLANAGI